MQGSIHEECGVFGIYSKNKSLEAAAIAYLGLFALQHRGQESCGITVSKNERIIGWRDMGLVNEVFTSEALQSLSGSRIAIGHVRYSTTGGAGRTNAQPMIVNHVKESMALAHNGNLTNAAPLRRELELHGAIFHTTSDTEVIVYSVIKESLDTDLIEDAVCSAMYKLKGAYSLVIMTSNKMIAVRDPNGFRPLCIGKLEDSYIFASESCALDAAGAEFVRDVLPGEIVIAEESGIRSITTHCNTRKKAMCVFEYIYFARPDSVIDGCCVNTARMQAGVFLSRAMPVEADVVIGIPDSGVPAAMGYAAESGIPYGPGFIKNKYIARTFIQPTQAQRERSVRIKLNPIASAVDGKRVVLVDDSIVRGTTSARIVKLLRDSGAKEVHMRISAPPFMHPCYFGTDIDSEENLIACKHSIEEITEIIGADSLCFLSLDDSKKLTNNPCDSFCTACFSGDYPVEPPETLGKSQFESI